MMSASQSRRMNTMVTFAVDAAGLAAIDAAARAAGVGRGSLARRHVLTALKLPDPIRQQRPAIPPSVDVAAIAEVTASLGRATGAAVQLARALREAGAYAQHAAAEAAIADLRHSASLAIGAIECSGVVR